MKRKNIVHLFVIVVVLLSGLIISEQKRAYACSCVAPGSYEEGLESNDWVFDGVVINKKTKSSLFGTKSTADLVEWTFQVNGSWKGEVTELMTVYSAESGVSCGYEFEVGKRYAVFARELEGIIKVSLCSKTSIIADNSDIFTELGSYTFEVNVPSTVDLRLDVANASHSPNFLAKIASEEKVKQSIQDRKMVLMVVFVSIALLFIISAFLLVRRMMRK